MEIKITADKKLLEALEKIAAALTTFTSAGEPAVAPVAPAPTKAEEIPAQNDKPAVEAPAAAPDIKPVPTRDEVQQLAIVKIQGGKRDAVKALVEKYGAPRVGEVDEDKLASFKAELEAL